MALRNVIIAKITCPVCHQALVEGSFEIYEGDQVREYLDIGDILPANTVSIPEGSWETVGTGNCSNCSGRIDAICYFSGPTLIAIAPVAVPEGLS